MSLTSGSSDVTVPPTLTVAAGQTTAPFMVMVVPSATGGDVTISAGNTSGAGVVKQVVVSVVSHAYDVDAVWLAPDDYTCTSQIRPGYVCQMGLRLKNAPAAGGVKVSLSSSYSAASLASSVTVPAGASTAKFSVTISPTASSGPAIISAVSSSNVIKSATLTILPPAKVVSLYATSAVEPGDAIGGSAKLDGWPPPAGMNVLFMSSSPSVTVSPSIPAVRASGHVVSAQDQAGSEAVFTGAVAPTAPFGDVSIGAVLASSGSAGMSTTLKVKRAELTSGSTCGHVFPGRTCTGQLNLDIRLMSPLTVNLSSSSSDVTVPASVVIPKLQSSAYYTISARTSAAVQPITITATQVGAPSVTKQFNLQVRLIQVSKIEYPAAFYVGKSSTGTVTLEDAADPGGVTVNLQVVNPAGNTGKISVPATITVPAGQSSVTFPITGVTAGHGGQIFAARNGSTVSVTFDNSYFNVY